MSLLGFGFSAAMLGFALGFNLANLLYWRLLRRVQKTMRAEFEELDARFESLQARSARIERDLVLAIHRADGSEPPPEVRQ